MKILRFDEIESTNTYAKTLLSGGEDALIIAERQTGGRGTKGRSFCSNEGGVYVTKLTFHADFSARDAFKIMANAATAVCTVLERFSLTPCIKWANDVFVNDRKICGILIENTLAGEHIAASIVGIGLNVNNELPEALKNIGISMREAAGTAFDKAAVEAALIEALEREYTVKEYISRVGYLNRKITLIEGDKRTPAYALSVTERGELIVKTADGVRKIAVGEVSIQK
ncbi:MAG: biotin--[Clostridia bacterium]|nr:biotin--[acetyl-CoA-carboxylase] ligase [Clostridia bacterium]